MNNPLVNLYVYNNIKKTITLRGFVLEGGVECSSGMPRPDRKTNIVHKIWAHGWLASVYRDHLRTHVSVERANT